ncbi:hypothetical protein KP509_13G018700 [Ceratopteris richardii]|uniref:Uncharacterized protein n=1 Tax=Ceratopteris richardii TaxID=49495 RepID=A0A8T2TH20_CERRI|nr:hypothetical protein KP509_13G018700 [Ceratopteris richardii]
MRLTDKYTRTRNVRFRNFCMATGRWHYCILFLCIWLSFSHVCARRSKHITKVGSERQLKRKFSSKSSYDPPSEYTMNLNFSTKSSDGPASQDIVNRIRSQLPSPPPPSPSHSRLSFVTNGKENKTDTDQRSSLPKDHLNDILDTFRPPPGLPDQTPPTTSTNNSSPKLHQPHDSAGRERGRTLGIVLVSSAGILQAAMAMFLLLKHRQIFNDVPGFKDQRSDPACFQSSPKSTA